MSVWHGVWSQEEVFFLWAEDIRDIAKASDGESATSVRPLAHPASLHPYHVPTARLLEPVTELDIGEFEETQCICYLPTRDNAPVPSPGIRFEKGGAAAPSAIEGELLTLRPWNVPALGADIGSAAYLLSALTDSLPPNIRLGESLIFFQEATKFALELLTRGRFLPSLRRTGRQFAARWNVVIKGEEDQERFRVLVASMPAVCGAEDPTGCFSDASRQELLLSFLTATVDALVRSFGRDKLQVENRFGRAAAPRIVAQSCWLKSLTDLSAVLPEDCVTVGASEVELLALDRRLQGWGGGLYLQNAEHDFRTTFQLAAPADHLEGEEQDEEAGGAEDKEPWRLSLLLQSEGDANLSFPVTDLWKGTSELTQAARQNLDDLEMALLGDLGKALGVFPQLKAAMERRSVPTELLLSTHEAYEFLQNTAPRLEQLGFNVLVPSWWRNSSLQLGLRVHITSDEWHPDVHSRSALAVQELLEFNLSLSLGDESISIEEFEQLVRQQAPLVRVKDGWVELKPKTVEEAMRFIDRYKKKKKLSVPEAIRLGLGVESDAAVLPITEFSATGWLGRLLHSDRLALDEGIEPPSFQGELRPYQREGLAWLRFLSDLGIGACLADDMGLGKTVQLLALLLGERQRRAEQDEPIYPTLLIVPLSILANWEQECRRFAPSLAVLVHHGPQRLNAASFRSTALQHDLILTTYSLAFRDESLLQAVPWFRVALDEAQNIKNVHTKQSRAIRRLINKQMMESSSGAGCHRLALTGTPLENHLDELWSIFDFLNPGFLGSLNDFRARFAVPIERFRDRKAAEGLSRLLRPFVLRRLKSDPRIAADLPEKIEMEEFVLLTKEQSILYKQTLDQMLPQVAGATGFHRKGLVLSTITKLKQICNHPSLVLKDRKSFGGRSVKITRLEELLEELLSEGDKALIFTQFVELGNLLKPYLQERFGKEVLFLHGSLTRAVREKMVQRFQEPSGPPIFLLSLRAGGFGLNLTQATQVIHLDQWWNPAVEDQATDRAYRIGQHRNVQVRKLVCKGTLEERIAQMVKSKRELAESVVQSTKNMITELSTDELRELLQLSGPVLDW